MSRETMKKIEKVKELAMNSDEVPSAYLEGLNDAIMIFSGYSVDEIIKFRKERKTWD